MDASIDFSGLLKGSIADGDTVVITPVVTSGTKIADVTVNGVEKDLYAPTPFSGSYNDLTDKPTIPGIEFNPAVPATDEVETIDLNGTIYDVKDGDARAEINQINQSLSNLVKSTTVMGTTTSTGALAIPNELKSKPLIDLHYDSASGLVFRRDNDYLTCLALSLQPFSKTSVSITVWYLDV